MVIRVAYRVVTGGGAEDNRSDEEYVCSTYSHFPTTNSGLGTRQRRQRRISDSIVPPKFEYIGTFSLHITWDDYLTLNTYLTRHYF